MKVKDGDMKVIGITGRVGSGKSEVLDHLEKNYKCIIIKADEVAHEVQAPGGVCFEAVTELLGPGCIREDGEIDKSKMAAAIFNDPELLKKVNAIVHPAVQESIMEIIDVARLQEGCEFVFLEAALLIEAGYKNICDEMWNISVSEDVRRQRLKASRGYSDEKIDSILSKQLPERELEEQCDHTFDNSSDIKTTMSRIDAHLCALG